jgi:hypothetical protein
MPDAHRMFTDKEGTDIMNEMIEGGHSGAGAADDDASEDEIEETIDVHRQEEAVSLDPIDSWKSLEDECLIDSWKAVSLDPITGANQTLGKYYARILDEFNERCHTRQIPCVECHQDYVQQISWQPRDHPQ